MNISSSNYSCSYRNSAPAFKGRADKLIELLKKTRNYKEVKITGSEAINIYEKLGYLVTNKAGSHMTIKHPNGFVFTLSLPHGGNKTINPNHVRTIQCAIFEDFQRLVHSIHFHRK